MFQDFPDNTNYKVVINHEEQYSLWPASKTTPAGWKDVGRTGSKQTCQACLAKPALPSLNRRGMDRYAPAQHPH